MICFNWLSTSSTVFWSIQHLIRVEWRYDAVTFDLRSCSISTIWISGSSGNVHVSLFDRVAGTKWLTDIVICCHLHKCGRQVPSTTVGPLLQPKIQLHALQFSDFAFEGYFHRQTPFLYVPQCISEVSNWNFCNSFAGVKVFQKAIRVNLICHLFPILPQFEKAIGCLSVHT